MHAVEQLSRLAAKTSQMEPQIPGTAPGRLSPSDIAARMSGLPPMQEFLLWSKYVGEERFYSRLHSLYVAACDAEPDIKRFLNPRRTAQKHVIARRENFAACRDAILYLHMGDWRCGICNGAAVIVDTPCTVCDGTGTEKMVMARVASLAGGIRVAWCWDNREVLQRCRGILIAAEVAACNHVVQQSK